MTSYATRAYVACAFFCSVLAACGVSNTNVQTTTAGLQESGPIVGETSPLVTVQLALEDSSDANGVEARLSIHDIQSTCPYDAIDVLRRGTRYIRVSICAALSRVKNDRQYQVVRRFGTAYLLPLGALPHKVTAVDLAEHASRSGLQCFLEKQGTWGRCPADLSTTRSLLIGDDTSRFDISEHSGLVASSDVPAWVFAELATLTRQIRTFATTSGSKAELSTPTLTVYASITDDHSQGFGASGEVLGNIVYLTLTGNDWAMETQEKHQLLAGVLSHEVFHALYPPCDTCAAHQLPDYAWLIEGYAEYFSRVFLRATWDTRWRQEAPTDRMIFRESFNDCIYFRNGAPTQDLLYIGNRQLSRLPYACGLALVAAQILLDKQIENAPTPRAGLAIDTWRGISEVQLTRSGDATVGDVVVSAWTQARRSVQESNVLRALSDIVESMRSGTSHMDKLPPFAHANGVGDVEYPALSEPLLAAVGPAWFFLVMQDDCEGAVSFEHERSGVIVADDTGCKQLKTDDRYSWAQIADAMAVTRKRCSGVDGEHQARATLVGVNRGMGVERSIAIPDSMCEVSLPPFV